MTIDQLIEVLQLARSSSKLAGKTPVVFSPQDPYDAERDLLYSYDIQAVVNHDPRREGHSLVVVTSNNYQWHLTLNT